MEIVFDPGKNGANIALRGLSFEMAKRFDFDSALILIDSRRDYGEVHYQAMGLIGNRLYFLVFTMRGQTLRVISLRLANRKEKALYDQQT
jgi:uncharacterized DUF497 family protein